MNENGIIKLVFFIFPFVFFMIIILINRRFSTKSQRELLGEIMHDIDLLIPEVKRLENLRIELHLIKHTFDNRIAELKKDLTALSCRAKDVDDAKRI